LDLFTCERQKMRLTAPGCSRLWLSAQNDPPKEWEGRASCVTCPIGAANAGRTISPVAESVAVLAKICPRCFRQSDRLIKKLLCVSCYNRQAEADRGYNAKGSRPRLCSALHVQHFAVIEGGRSRHVAAPQVTSLVEAIIALSKQATDRVCFGAPRIKAWLGRSNPQMELGIGIPHVRCSRALQVSRAPMLLALPQMELSL
jgi:hypothetical protein